MAFELIVPSAKGHPRAFQGQARIGRSGGNDVVLRDARVSRWHARVFPWRGRYFAEDVGSVNGTLLNGLPLRGPRELFDGDSLSVGGVAVAFRLPPGSEPFALGPGGFLATPTTGIFPPTGQGRGGLRVRAHSRQALLGRSRRRTLARGLALAGVALCLSAGFALRWGRGATSAGAVEPTRLAATPLRDTFGMGPGVRWHHASMKRFEFDVASPGRALGLLHYRTQREARGRLAVVLNGARLWQPALETRDARGSLVTQPLPPRWLKRSASNQVSFQRVDAPSLSRPWQVWDVWVEVFPVGELAAPELDAHARRLFERARSLERLRQVAPDNLFRAWMDGRRAWRLLAAMDEPPEWEQLARVEVERLENELDRECGKLLWESERALQLKGPSAARQILASVATFFPTGEHHCRSLALEKLSLLETLDHG